MAAAASGVSSPASNGPPPIEVNKNVITINTPIEYNLYLSFDKNPRIKWDRTIYRKTSEDPTDGNRCLVVTTPSGGIGNLLGSLINGIFLLLKSNGYYTHLYFILTEVEHDSTNTIENIFPSLYELPFIGFGDSKAEMHTYLKDNEINAYEDSQPQWGTFHNYIEYFEDPEIKEFIQRYFKIHPAIIAKYTPEFPIQKKDIDNGIFVHIRYGDMLRYNLECLNQIQRDKYILMLPIYYAKYILYLYKLSPSKIFIFTDSMPIVKKLLEQSFRKLLTESDYEIIRSNMLYPEDPVSGFIKEDGVKHIIYLLTYCKRAIISYSTLSGSCRFMNQRPDKLTILPGYNTPTIPIDVLLKLKDHEIIDEADALKLKKDQILVTPNYIYVKKHKIEQKDYKYITDAFENEDPFVQDRDPAYKGPKLKKIADILAATPITRDNLDSGKYIGPSGQIIPFVEGKPAIINEKSGMKQCESWSSSFRPAAAAAGGAGGPSSNRNHNTSSAAAAAPTAPVLTKEENASLITFLQTFVVESYAELLVNLYTEMMNKARSDAVLTSAIEKKFGSLSTFKSAPKSQQILIINRIKEEFGIDATAAPATAAASAAGVAAPAASAVNAAAPTAKIYCTFLNELKKNPGFLDVLNKKIQDAVRSLDIPLGDMLRELRTKIRKNNNDYEAIIEEELQKCSSAAKGGRRSRKNKRQARKRSRRH